MSIAEEIKRLMEAKGFTTQKQLADAAGLSQPFVARILSGQRPNLTAEVLFKLCRALSVDCSHFAPFFVSDPQPPRPGRPRKGDC